MHIHIHEGGGCQNHVNMNDIHMNMSTRAHNSALRPTRGSLPARQTHTIGHLAPGKAHAVTRAVTTPSFAASNPAGYSPPPAAALRPAAAPRGASAALCRRARPGPPATHQSSAAARPVAPTRRSAAGALAMSQKAAGSCHIVPPPTGELTRATEASCAPSSPSAMWPRNQQPKRRARSRRRAARRPSSPR